MLRGSQTEVSIRAEQVRTVAFCMITATAPLLLELIVEAVRSPGADDLLERVVLLGALAWTSLFILVQAYISNPADVFPTVVCGDWIIVIGCLNSLLRARTKVSGPHILQRIEVFPFWYNYLLTGNVVVMGVLMKIYTVYPSYTLVQTQNCFAWFAILLMLGKLVHWAAVIWLGFETSVFRLDVLWENLSVDHWLSLKMWSLLFVLLTVNIFSLPPPSDLANLQQIDSFTPLRVIMVLVGMLVVVYAALGLPGETRARSLFLEKELTVNRTIIRFVSHEMRTPLNTIIGALQLLEDQLKRHSRIPKEVGDYLTEIKGASTAAVEVLDDLLLYEQLESNNIQLRREHRNPIDFLNESFVSLRTAAMEANVGVALRIENREELSSLSLCVDDRRMKLAVRNVLMQIINSSSPGKQVEVVVYLRVKRSVKGVHKQHRRRNSVVPLRIAFNDPNVTLRIRIRDTSLAAADQSFDDVRALNTVPRNAYDMGRWIAKRIIELHGGIVASRLRSHGDGSVVTICLPLHHSWDRVCDLVRNNPVNPSEMSISDMDPVNDFEALFSFMYQRRQGDDDSLSASSKRHPRSRHVAMPSIPEDLNCLEAQTSEGDNPIAGACPKNHPVSSDQEPLRLDLTNASSADAVITPQDPHNLRMLIVDDSVGTVRVMRKLMESKGHVCSVAFNGAEALEIFKVQSMSPTPFNLVLLDNCMPIMTGPECAMEIRHLGYDGPIFGVTGHSLQDDIEAFKKSGADEVIIKPLVYDSFKETYVTWSTSRNFRGPTFDMRV